MTSKLCLKSLKMTVFALLFVLAPILFASTVYAAEPQIIMSLSFEADSGETFIDGSGNGNHAEFFDSDLVGMDFFDSPFGQGIWLDGANQYFEIPEAVFDRDELTLAFWVRWEGGARWQRLIELGSWVHGEHFMIVPLTAENFFQMSGWNYLTQRSFIARPALPDWAFPRNEWVHVAITQDAETLTCVYINGEPLVMTIIVGEGEEEETLRAQTEFVAGVSIRYANNPTAAEGRDIFRRFGASSTSTWDAKTAASYGEIKVFDGVLTQVQIQYLISHNNITGEGEPGAVDLSPQNGTAGSGETADENGDGPEEAEPTPEPTAEPTPEPTAEPTPAPTAEPTPTTQPDGGESEGSSIWIFMVVGAVVLLALAITMSFIKKKKA